MTTAQLVQCAMSARRTVRIAWYRDTERCQVTIRRGDIIEEQLAVGVDEPTAEEIARVYARHCGLDVSRVDVDP